MKNAQGLLASQGGCPRESRNTYESRSGEEGILLQEDFRTKRSGLLIKEAKFSCLPDSLHTVVDAQFREDMAHMSFDGIKGNHQFLGNLLVGCPTSQQLQDLSFSLTQWLRQLVGLRS